MNVANFMAFIGSNNATKCYEISLNMEKYKAIAQMITLTDIDHMQMLEE